MGSQIVDKLYTHIFKNRASLTDSKFGVVELFQILVKGFRSTRQPLFGDMWANFVHGSFRILVRSTYWRGVYKTPCTFPGCPLNPVGV